MKIFIYFEEIDLCKKLIKNEKKIFLDTSIKINHFGEYHTKNYKL